VADLGLEAGEVGVTGAKLEVIEVAPPPERTPGRIIEGEPAEAAKEVVRLLREEAKVI
jgi:electron transfer flavoprotein beta subunit